MANENLSPAFGLIGNALKSTAADHIVAVSEDLYDYDLGMYQSDINRSLIGNGGTGAPHYFMTTSQYEEMVVSGSVVVNGNTIEYDENAYYALYESDEQTI